MNSISWWIREEKFYARKVPVVDLIMSVVCHIYSDMATIKELWRFPNRAPLTGNYNPMLQKIPRDVPISDWRLVAAHLGSLPGQFALFTNTYREE